ncbi:MAG TPA: aspartate kinase [Actinomycetota bacterium]|nr:aspartate kinase [Actinomycetota bacterium]
MAVVVQKYGGSSVADIALIGRVAERVIGAKRAGLDVVVVVSAMGETTDQLMAQAHELTPMPNPRELDLLLTAGERIAMSLLAIAINAQGYRAASYTGSQAGIITDTRHGKAEIIDIRPGRIRESLERGDVVIVAGFQGVSTAFDVTTLGRGGSDTTAAALAAALGADFCEIYTDVPGVFTADPRIVRGTRKLHAVSYEEMLEMAATGARVLELRSVEYARNSKIRLHVRSAFSDQDGTWIAEEDERMERAIIAGVTHDESDAKITVRNVPDRPGVVAAIFQAVAAEGVNVDMIVQNVSKDGRTDVSFTVPKADLLHACSVIERVGTEVKAEGFSTDDEIAKVSLVGAGMRSQPGVAADVFSALADEGINVEMITTSPIRISCVVRASDVARAAQVLHDRFSLGEDAVLREH